MPRILLLILAAAALPASAAFKCTDEKGVKHYEDVLPAACANVTIFEVSSSGTVVRKIEPPKAAAPVEPKKAETDRATLDRERRDRTLRDTYASEKEIDQARDRSLELIKARRQSAQSQLELVKKRRAQLEANKNTPKGDLEGVAKEQTSLEHAIASYEADAANVTAQYDTDKVRWRELSGKK
jgi:hypothetical protein